MVVVSLILYSADGKLANGIQPLTFGVLLVFSCHLRKQIEVAMTKMCIAFSKSISHILLMTHLHSMYILFKTKPLKHNALSGLNIKIT